MGSGVAAGPAGGGAVAVPTAAAGFTIASAGVFTTVSEEFAAGLTAGVAASAEAGAVAAGEDVSAIDGLAAIAFAATGVCAGVGFSSLGGGSGGMAA